VALEDLGVSPAEAVYVGDRPDVDAPAAAAAGVRCVLISGRRPAHDGKVPQVRDFRQLMDLFGQG